EQNQDTHQVVLWCLGEAHMDVALERLRSRYGVQVDAVPYKVSLRETFGTRSAGRGRHVKQSGGHGQYAICEIEVEPLPEGSGIEFVDKVVGGAVPRQFIPSVEKGVRAQAARGVAAGYPLVDLSGRRGRVVGTEQSGGGQTLIRAEVPEIEIGRYAVDLRSLSHGTGRFNRSYARHEPMPTQVADRIQEQAEA
ncbi:elongation factor G-like protein EF-G2, partial [Streptomyces sp. MCAF7]